MYTIHNLHITIVFHFSMKTNVLVVYRQYVHIRRSLAVYSQSCPFSLRRNQLEKIVMKFLNTYKLTDSKSERVSLTVSLSLSLTH